MSETAVTQTPGQHPRTAGIDGTGTHVGVWVRRILVLNLAAEIGIIVTGGLVRLTGSGLGCSTWPECVPGSYVPTPEQEEGFHKFVEFGNRLLTFALVAAALAVLWAVYARLRHRRGFVLPAWLLLAGILAQAVVGGITVLTGLSPVTVSFHFLASAALVALSTYLLYRLDEGDAAPRLLVPRLVRTVAWACSAAYAAVLTLGTVVTGSGPHSGDADQPARYGFDPRTISWLHADAVMLFLGLAVAVWLAVRLTDRSRRAVRAWAAVLALCIAQGLLGYVQYLTALPEALVLLHMTLAALLTAAITWAVLTLRTR